MDAEAVMRLVALITVIQAIFPMNLPLGQGDNLPDATEPRAQTIGKTYGGAQNELLCFSRFPFESMSPLFAREHPGFMRPRLQSPPLKRPRPVRLQEKATEGF
jgi:hypothetical protein